MNKETMELIEKLERMRPVESLNIIASMLGMEYEALRNMLERFDLPWGIDAALPEEKRHNYKIFTQRLIVWLKGEDMKKFYVEEEAE